MFLVLDNMVNYFELFQIPVSYSVGRSELQNRYFELQQQFHPDRIGRDVQDVGISSADINNAYRVLKDDFMRAEHILALHDLRLQDAVLPTSFMMQMMQLREMQLIDPQQFSHDCKFISAQYYESMATLILQKNWHDALIVLAQINTLRAVAK